MSELALPKGWVKAKINDVSIKISQKKPDDSDEFFYVDISSINRETKKINNPNLISGADAPSRARKIIAKGDVIVSLTRPNLNAVALIDEKYDGHIASTGFEVIRPVLVESRYIFEIVRSFDFVNKLSRDVQGALYPAAKSSDVQGYEIPLPPLAEQKVIAHTLDSYLTTVSQITARLDAIPKLIEKFRQSVIRDAVSGALVSYKSELNEVETISLENLITSSMNGLSKRSGNTGEEEIVLRLADFKDAKRTFGGERKIRITSEELEKYRIDVGDILIIRVNGSADLAGKFILYKREEQSEAFCDHFIKIKLDLDKVRPEFVVLIANEGEGRHYLRNSLSTSAGQNTINQKSVKGLEFRLPPLEIQDKIIQTVKQFFAHANQIEKSVATAKARVDHLTQSILHQAFTGNLTAEWREQNPDLISGDNSAEALLAKIKAEKQDSGKKKSGKG